jgi:hypothetical protein
LYVLFFIASSNSWKILILVDSIATVSIATLWQAKFSGIIGEKFCFVWIFFWSDFYGIVCVFWRLNFFGIHKIFYNIFIIFDKKYFIILFIF